ncbi:response regulator [Chloroflexus sp.]|uniref:response regulator n=1 Tax=Chloroflexus sp. TaxID=1904827 RepID=UPI0026391CA2|nr:response regulator [uncultured Chloroflexus sp.]
MSKSPPEVERFVHQIVSPLTALQSAVDLLAHHYGRSNDQRLVNLIAALQRSTLRIRQFSQQLTERTRLEDHELVVRIPINLYQAEPSAPASALSAPAVGVEPGLAVLAGTTELDIVEQSLAAIGWQVERVSTCALGLDTARRRRPRLLIISDEMTDIDPIACAQIARTDPETRDILVVLACHQPMAGNGVPQIDLRQSPLEQLRRVLMLYQRHSEQSVPRILVVDDEADIRQILSHQLTDAGFVVVTAPDGATAMELATTQHVDLIVLDRMLPDGDGLQVLQKLRTTPATQLTPVMLLSAISALDEKVRSLQLGADDYVVKPCSAAELAARIRSILRRSERESSVNPISRLPGNVVIEQVIHERLANQQSFAVSYIDLDNFKGYNDHYGFFKGDAVILHTARLLAEVVHWRGDASDFLGHLGGDDFVLVTTLERAQHIGQAMIERFDTTIPYFYSAEDRARGYIFGRDRQGNPCRYPLLSISIAVVPVVSARYRQPYEIALRAAEIKRQLKTVTGSCLMIDRDERGQ